MHFMFLILAFLLCTVVWGFFHANPKGVNVRVLLACNVVILALALALALGAAIPFYGDAAAKPGHWAIAVSLAAMVGGSGFMIVVAVGGLVRNLVVFPLSRRRLA